MAMVHFIISRLKEPSTYAGFAGLALALGMSGELYNATAATLAAIAGLVSVVLAEKAK